MLARVGIPQPARRFNDYAHQFSGGMRQRAMIAMALVNDPTAADRRRADHGARRDRAGADPGPDPGPAGGVRLGGHHDHPRPGRGGRARRRRPGDVRRQGHRAAARRSTCSTNPQHPYTWGLLGSMPRLDRDVRDRLTPVKGSPPSLINLPSGCAFHPRCPYAGRNGDRSFTEVPVLRGGAALGRLPPAGRRSAAQIFQQDVAAEPVSGTDETDEREPARGDGAGRSTSRSRRACSGGRSAPCTRSTAST